jgi:uncharacterized protein YgbK (DUF1537 family)
MGNTDARLPKTETLNALPPEWPASLLPEIRTQLAAGDRKLVVLDDDPTGTQTVHGIPVLTEWSVNSLTSELQNDSSVFYILTNSRSLPLLEAQALNAGIGRNLVQAARQSGRDFAVVSRSDSTLRGHFPGEVDALLAAIGQDVDAWLIIPFFLEGGRYTLNDTHYVAEGEWLTPAGQTEFARDSAFGYRASDLKAWVAEKTGGRVPSETVASISMNDVRKGGPKTVAEKLGALEKGAVCVINAASYRDQEVFVSGLLAAEAAGKRFIYRTAASFVQVRAGLSPRPILTQADLAMPSEGGGLVIVGSYVPKTTSQLNSLLNQTNIRGVEINVESLLDDARQQAEIARVAGQADEALRQNEDVVIYTSRKLVTVIGAEQSLSIGRRVSDSLVALVRSISVRPRYILAKGGITSSDVATKGLDVRRAIVAGQILPGVPLWQLGAESRYPGVPYIVFPGNVGDENAVASVVKALKAH